LASLVFNVQGQGQLAVFQDLLDCHEIFGAAYPPLKVSRAAFYKDLAAIGDKESLEVKL
jgi:hypothetical protein